MRAESLQQERRSAQGKPSDKECSNEIATTIATSMTVELSSPHDDRIPVELKVASALVHRIFVDTEKTQALKEGHHVIALRNPSTEGGTSHHWDIRSSILAVQPWPLFRDKVRSRNLEVDFLVVDMPLHIIVKPLNKHPDRCQALAANSQLKRPRVLSVPCTLRVIDGRNKTLRPLFVPENEKIEPEKLASSLCSEEFKMEKELTSVTPSAISCGTDVIDHHGIKDGLYKLGNSNVWSSLIGIAFNEAWVEALTIFQEQARS
ncbi:hypothetical protein Cgig2_012908 [Carnegiea gigantea]|uniref:Uncharacterized protein n=1 Tax=Carnegiea gigantea TaxID=171969 RepID=A0A9Q1K648_9CARY|nr:hypothetical protein Cgig2_012908 [Carnegiea gigantea]